MLRSCPLPGLAVAATDAVGGPTSFQNILASAIPWSRRRFLVWYRRPSRHRFGISAGCPPKSLKRKGRKGEGRRGITPFFPFPFFPFRLTKGGCDMDRRQL